MSRRILSLVCLVVLFPGLTVLAQDDKVEDKVALKWKFEKGKPLYQEVTTESVQKIKVMNLDLKQDQKQTFTFSWLPESEKDGSWTIKQKIDAARMNLSLGKSKIDYDSNSPPVGSNPLGEFFKNLLGAEFTITLSPEMKVTSLEGRKQFLDRLSGANAQMKPLLDKILTEDALKQMAETSFASIPGGEKKVGDTWKTTSALNLGPIGVYDTTHEYKLEGKEKDLDKISVKTTLTYKAPAGGDSTGLPFRITKADLTAKDGTGTILFNSKEGRIESAEMSLNLAGKLDIELGGVKTTVELNQEQKTTTKFTADPPKPN